MESPLKRSLKLAAFQTGGEVKNAPQDAFNLLEQILQKVTAEGADVLVVPELFLSGYNIGERVKILAEENNGPSCKKVADLAKKYHIAIAFTYAEREENLYYNSIQVVDSEGKMLVNYRKTHLYDPHHKYERVQFQEGQDFAQVITIKGIKIGVLICWDIEIVEPARIMALKGAELLLVPSANADSEYFGTRITVPSRAFENHLFVCYVNRSGAEGTAYYSGDSCIVGPDGKDLARARGVIGDCILMANIEPEHFQYQSKYKNKSFGKIRRILHS